jgi:apolipoprotein N-acyltransferase
VPVAVVQGNIDQNVKWDPVYVDGALAAHRTLTLEAARAGARLVVWPETAVPLRDRKDPRWRQVERLAQEAGVYLLVGAPHGAPRETVRPPHNSAFLIGPTGDLGRYDKRHLLPLGEYVPWERALGFFRVAGGPASEFSGGWEATVFATPIGRVATVICYEAIFPAEVRDFFLAGADILVNITNDAYFGPTPTPVQHLALTVFRAVEHRAWLVRAANTGISAIVAPDGHIVRASPLFARGVLAGTIAPRRETTFYTRYGDVFAWGALGVAIAALVPLPFPRGRAAEVTPAG